VRLKNKNIFFHFEKRCSLLQLCLCSCKFRSRRIGCKKFTTPRVA
jgi:hypothetical protein